MASVLDPDLTRKHYCLLTLFLLARETLAACEMVRHQKDSEDMGRSEEDRKLSAGLSKFEEDRLSNIRADLIKIGVAYGNVSK